MYSASDAINGWKRIESGYAGFSARQVSVRRVFKVEIQTRSFMHQLCTIAPRIRCWIKRLGHSSLLEILWLYTHWAGTRYNVINATTGYFQYGKWLYRCVVCFWISDHETSWGSLPLVLMVGKHLYSKVLSWSSSGQLGRQLLLCK